MEKRYQVFVSSTYDDLKDERSKVIQALMEMDCMPSGMEIFPAADEEQWEFIKKIVDDCDYYVLIIGGKYGSVAKDGISYTEKEYDYAVSKGIKIIALLRKDPIPSKYLDTDPVLCTKLEAFRKRVSDGRLVKFWERADELPGIVALSLTKTIKTFPAVGWVRANQPTVENADLKLALFRAEEEARNIETLFLRQLETNHHSISEFRDYLFKDVRIPLSLVEQDKEKDIGEVSKTYLYHVCYSLLSHTRKSFQDYFTAKGYAIGEDLSLTVKLIVTQEEANRIQNQAKEAQPTETLLIDLSEDATFVITAFRDPYTWEHRIERKEVEQVVYRAEDNTAFDEILNKRKRAYYSNNLKEQAEQGRYKNQHFGWNDLYNAVLVLPIRYRPEYEYKRKKTLFYGLLCIDSKNPNNFGLFGEGAPYYMLANTADMLAMMLGHIDIIQFSYKI